MNKELNPTRINLGRPYEPATYDSVACDKNFCPYCGCEADFMHIDHCREETAEKKQKAMFLKSWEDHRKMVNAMMYFVQTGDARGIETEMGSLGNS